MLRFLIFVSAGFIPFPLLAASSRPLEITVNMKIDVDGAPNAYGPKGKKALDYERNAHEGARASGRIVGYLTRNDGTPELQGRHDPFPGYYISTTGFCDQANPNLRDPRRYVNASKVNYVVLADIAKENGVVLGDFVAVYSKKTHRAVFGIIGDSGNPDGRKDWAQAWKGLERFGAKQPRTMTFRNPASQAFTDLRGHPVVFTIF